MTKIHPTAVVEDGAQIAASAEIGPFCWISSKAKIGENVRLLARVTVYGDTTIGEGTVVFPGAVLGTGPQDHGNEFQDDAKLVIGKRNVIRENVTMHAGTPKGQSDPQDGSTPEKMITRVGDDGMFMVNSHVAHDCVVGNNVIMTNNAVIGGHVRVGDGAILGGHSAVHQFCRLSCLRIVRFIWLPRLRMKGCRRRLTRSRKKFFCGAAKAKNLCPRVMRMLPVLSCLIRLFIVN